MVRFGRHLPDFSQPKKRSALLHRRNAGMGIFVLDLMEVNQPVITSGEEDGLAVGRKLSIGKRL
jgi:hypothetical protein